MKVCIIGAGISGLSCLHQLTIHGIEFDCFEKRDSLGGLWNYSETENSVYKNCQQNHPRTKMHINQTAIENSSADYLTHQEYLSYLQQFDSPNIHYNHNVEHAEYDEQKHCWQVKVNGMVKAYSHLVVCSGHYTEPHMPSFYDRFSGELIHSKDYKVPEAFSGERVLVVGGGSSAVQIASDLAGIASEVTLSVKTMPFILPRYIDEQVLLEFYQSVRHLPEDDIVNILQQHGIDQTLFDIPAAEQGLLTGSTLPICDSIFNHTQSKNIKFVKSAQQINGNSMCFDDTELTFDSVILATGYRLAFPFFDFKVDYEDNQDLLINQQHQQLYFIGMAQPVGPVPPLLQIQSEVVAKLINDTTKRKSGSSQWKNTGRRIVLADYIAHLSKEYELEPEH